MGHSCCGNHNHHKDTGEECRGQSAKASRSSIGALWITVLVVAIGAGAATMYALDQPTAAPAASAKPAGAAPPATPPAAEPMKGVVRHGRVDPIAKPTTGAPVRIATYNIENFFDNALPAGGSGGGTAVKPAAHRRAAAEAIHKINADIIALQEIESKEVLTRFRDEYLKDMGYAYVCSLDAGDGRGIEQSLLSRFPISDEKNWPGVALDAVHPNNLGNKKNPEAGKPIVLHRSPLRATVSVPAREGAKAVDITFFVVHHKSGPYYGYEREAEAAKVLSLVREFEKDHPGRPVLVLGDFNARMTESPVEIYTGGGLVSAMTGVPGGVESTEFTSHVSGRTIDHILVNAPGAAMVALDSRFVLGTLQRPEGVDWRKTQPPAGYCSDHYPVVVDLIVADSAGAPTHGLTPAVRPPTAP
ncbi:MAG TPA: endonuclease/exonuclease/phosphatase family protein [Phycisphaerales bacterium]|nr:endonuclease/exonuclease/phosphatase family protein [Phycisphaerales bacterium]